MKYLLFLILLTSCASPESGIYNSNDEQDGVCYSKLGGMLGYCDKSGVAR